MGRPIAVGVAAVTGITVVHPPNPIFSYYEIGSHEALRSRHPGLTARLLARTDGRDVAEPTWMEIYEHPQGLSEAFLADLEAAVGALPTGLIAPRHTETFAELPLPAGQWD